MEVEYQATLGGVATSRHMGMRNHEEFTVQGGGSINLLARRTIASPQRGVVLIVHGVAEHSGRYAEMEDWLTERGFSCYGYDQRGHGRSGGARVHVNRFDDYVGDLSIVASWVSQKEHHPLFLYGHSMGCVVAIHGAVSAPTPWQGLVLSSCPVVPGLSPPKWRLALATLLSAIAPRFALPSELSPGLLSRDPLVGQQYEADELVEKQVTARWATEFLDACQKALDQAAALKIPLLLLHGGGDEVASLEGARLFLEKAGSNDKTMKEYPNLRHELHHELRPAREQVFEDISQWLAAHIS